MTMNLTVELSNYKPVRNGLYQVWSEDGYYMGQYRWNYTHWEGAKREIVDWDREYWCQLPSLEVSR
jgi:DUF971 family protein